MSTRSEEKTAKQVPETNGRKRQKRLSISSNSAMSGKVLESVLGKARISKLAINLKCIEVSEDSRTWEKPPLVLTVKFQAILQISIEKHLLICSYQKDGKSKNPSD